MAERRRILSLVAVPIWASLALGCVGLRAYRPATPAIASTASATLELDQLTRGGGLVANQPDTLAVTQGMTVRVRWRAPRDGLGIGRAFLVPPDAAPCSLGLVAELIDVDGQTRWDRPLGLGRAHEITFAFPEDQALATGPLALDVEVTGPEGGTCVRLPVTGGGQRYSGASARAIGVFAGVIVPMRWDAAPGLRLDGAAGRWLGPLRLTLRLGLSFGNATFSVGGSSDEVPSSHPRFFDLHVAPEVTFFPFVHGSFVLGVALAVDVGSGIVGAEPERDFDWWGPRLGVILAYVHPPPLGAPAHRPLGGGGFEVFLSRPSSWPTERNVASAYVLGVGLAPWW